MQSDSLLPFQRLDVYVQAKEFARLVHAAKISDRELREQATDAAKSMFLRLCEGLPNDGVAMRNRCRGNARSASGPQTAQRVLHRVAQFVARGRGRGGSGGHSRCNARRRWPRDPGAGSAAQAHASGADAFALACLLPGAGALRSARARS